MSARYVDSMRGRGEFELTGKKRPNMVFVSFDMVPREFYLPREGDLVPRTPHLDALRADGLFFSNAYATSPLCSPSRAALFTGRHSYITANGERHHDGQQVHVRADDVIYPEYLKAAGYRTRHFGKCHIGAAKFLDAFGENDKPWDRWSPPWYDDDGYRDFLARKGAAGLRFSRRIQGRAPSGAGAGNFLGGWVERADGSPFPRDATYPAYVTELALAGLRARGTDVKPFYFQVDYFEPHQPFFIPSGFQERERELRAALALPESWEAAVGGKEPWGPLPAAYARYRKYWGLSDRTTAEDYLVAHALQYEILDEQIGRLVSRLKEEGLYDDCLIVLTADHGEMNCRNALVDKGAYLNPRVLQVPLYLKGPASADAGARKGGTVDRAVSLLDVAPTILDQAGVAAKARLDGVPLVGSRSPADASGRPPILAEVFSHVVPNPAAALISETKGGTRLYTANFADETDEYYARDAEGAWTERNLIGDPALKEEIEEARRRMLSVFDADERWVSYAAFLRLIHAETFAEEADLQKFVAT